MRALLAFDKFKDSLTADQACAAAAEALRAVHGEWTLDACPLADGGEGFAAILTKAAGGEWRQIRVTGPRGTPVMAAFGLVPAARIPAAARQRLGIEAGDSTGGAGAITPASTVAIVEMAAASGLALLAAAERDVWQTTTAGTGELLRAAAAAGATAIILGVGGSATSDLGLGALARLGLEFGGAAGEPVGLPVPAAWGGIAAIHGRVNLPPVHIACDVTNPLLGPNGAAAVYGPQKGLLAPEVPRFDGAAAQMARRLCAHFGRSEALMDTPGAGAAGGIAFGLMVAADARLLPGAEFVADWLDLPARIAAADVVLTGEGRFDDSSLSGKGPGAVAARARALGKPVHVFAGAVTTGGAPPGMALHAITPSGTPLEQALREAAENLRKAVAATFLTTKGHE